MTPAGLVPLMRYRDMPVAIDWLCNAFGFEQRAVVADGCGGIAYAELSYGSGVVMLGPVGQSGLDTLLKQPSDLDGANTQSCYVAVDDVEAHYRRAKAAGAVMVLEFGGAGADRAYAARDPEGHIWNFGAYSPWTSTAPAPVAEPASDLYWPASRLALAGHTAIAASVLLLAAVSAAGVWQLPERTDAGIAMSSAQQLDPPVQRTLTAVAAAPSKSPADASTGSLRQIESERRARKDSEDQAAALRKALDAETQARRDAVRATVTLREQLTRERSARAAAEAASTATKAQLIREREAKLTTKTTERERSAAIAKIEAQDQPPNSAAPVVPETTGSLNPGTAPGPTNGQTVAPASQPVTTEPIQQPQVSTQTPPATKAPQKSKSRTTVKRSASQTPAQSKSRKTTQTDVGPFFNYD